MAGNQFSVPLIDFGKDGGDVKTRWESVLRPPDRLPNGIAATQTVLGISSPSP